MRNRSNLTVGGIFIILGILFLLRQLGIVQFDLNFGTLMANFWPMFIIIPGLAFHYGFFAGNGKEPGLLVPGGILLVTGLTCQISMLTGLWGVMWPGFILSVAVGLFELYAFGNKEKGLLIPVGILGGLSAIFFASTTMSWLLAYSYRGIFVSAMLILFGILLIVKRK